MPDKIFNILILCTGNSARSIMAEGLFNSLGQGRFKAYSAGSKPAGKVNPFAIEQLESLNYASPDLRSKSWDEFAREDAPQMDIVITVCDNAAGEVCPIWPGVPLKAHWGFEDPGAGDTEAEKRASFQKVFNLIKHSVELICALPLETMSSVEIKQALDNIGKLEHSHESI